MINNIDSAIASLAVDINLLSSLENNARRGNVNAIKASYAKFGQLKPIVAVKDTDGKLTVIAGNHQLEAARQLGWDSIAVSVVDLDQDEALAFALADNRISDLGSTDNDMLYGMLSSVLSDDEAFFEVLGWDDFSIAAIENSIISSEFSNDNSGGWVAPEIVVNEVAPVVQTTPVSPQPQSQPSAPLPPTSTIVTQGSTSTSSSGSSNASIQFTLVFDSSEQQSKWYSFLRWLKESPVYDGDTTSERLLDFIAQHSEKG